MTIFYFVLKRYFRYFSNIVFLCILPIGFVFLPTYEGLSLPIGFQYYGILLMFISSRLAGILMEDRTNKILLRVGVSPITHFQYLCQNLLAYSLLLVVLNGIVVVLGTLVHGNQLNHPIMLWMTYSVFSMTVIGFSFAWYSFFRNKEASFSLLGGVLVILSMLGGILWPVEIMPIAMQRFAMLLPTYWLVEAQQFVISGANGIDFFISLIVLMMFSVVFILLGSRKRIN